VAPATLPSIEEVVRRVDDELASFLRTTHAALPEGRVLTDEIERLVGAGGKRIRPSFCYWGYRAAGGRDPDAITRAAASLELLHTFAIVHDDIMDSSDERRGLPTTYAKHGVNVALLVGDLALVLADELFMGSGFPPEALARGFIVYSRMRQQVIAGQYLDIEAEARADVTVEEARRIAVLKSGRYSIEEPLLIGAALAGAPAAFNEGVRRFGAPLGEAFQLRDDLLGTFGDRESIGKPVDSDIREGKRHVLYAHALRLLDADDRAFFIARWGAGDTLSTEEVERLRGLIESSGARAETERLLAELEAAAHDQLDRLDVPDAERRVLAELARRATDRRI